MAPEGRTSLWRKAGLISSLTMLSRLLGLVREQVFAALLGAGFYSDAFVIAFRIPNLLRDLFAEGALSSAFVPAYTRAIRDGGKESAHRLASRVFSGLTVVLAVVVLALFLGSELLVRTMAFGFEPQKMELTVLLTRLMLPFLPLVSFAAVAMGMLNAEERFSMPALAPAMFNVVSILCVVVLWSLHLSPYHVAIGWSVATVLGGLAQFAIQVPALRQSGWRFRFDWAPRDSELRRIVSQMAPAIVGLAAVQINIFVSSAFASQEDAALTWLQCAFRILYLPIGIFGVAVGTVAATGLARQVASGDLAGVGMTLSRSLRSLAFLTAPSTVGLVVLATPIVRLLFEHGAFARNPDNTAHTATALAIYAVGLMAYASVKILAPAFYALGRPRVPLLASASAVITNIVAILLLHPHLGYQGIAIGLVISTFVNVAILAVVLRRRVGSLGGPSFASFARRVAASAAVMGLVTYAAAQGLEAAFGTRGWAQAVVALGPVVLGVVSYFGLARLLGVSEAETLLAALRRRR